MRETKEKKMTHERLQTVYTNAIGTSRLKVFGAKAFDIKGLEGVHTRWSIEEARIGLLPVLLVSFRISDTESETICYRNKG
jgi:hypothetical protein